MTSTQQTTTRCIPGNLQIRQAVQSDALLQPQDLQDFEARYEEYTRRFYSHFPEAIHEIFVNDAIYHRERYLDMFSFPVAGRTLELGSDKPFITHFLRHLNPGVEFHTVSMDIPHSPYPIFRTDIECEEFPFEDGFFRFAIFAEVIEHLWRDPSWALCQLNRCLAIDGCLLVTTPNACALENAVNIILQSNPNGRNQFFAAMESGHPHLWTIAELRTILEAHGFAAVDVSTPDMYPSHSLPGLKELADSCSPMPDGHGQVIRIVARKIESVYGPAYPQELFPDGKPVQVIGAMAGWLQR